MAREATGEVSQWILHAQPMGRRGQKSAPHPPELSPLKGYSTFPPKLPCSYSIRYLAGEIEQKGSGPLDAEGVSMIAVASVT